MTDTTPQPNEFLAVVLRQGSGAFAGFTAAELLEARPDAARGLDDPLTIWKEWITNRVEELAVAVSAGKPELFARQVGWAVCLFTARNISSEIIADALRALGRVLVKELPEGTQSQLETYFSPAMSVLLAPAADAERLAADTDEARLAASYLLALLEGDRRKAISIMHDAASEGWSVVDLYAKVLAPAQHEIGRMWLEDEINVAEEHLATATTKMVMSQLRAREPSQTPNGRTVIAASVPGNQHDVGLQMVADVFEIYGWRTISLGANVPTPDLVQALEAFQADLLLISAALAKHLPTVRDTIRAVRDHQPTADTKILVGGMAFTDVADLARQFGADGYAANATDGLRVGCELVGLAEPE